MKKGPLSKIEKQFIVDNKEKTIEEIAEHLSRSVGLIEKFYKTTEEKKEEPPKSGDLLARNERYGVVTMTETASMAGDEARKKEIEKKKKDDNPLPPRYRQSIHRFREE